MTESKSFNRVATIILTVLVIVTLLPIVLLVIASFTQEQALIQDGYSFFPKAFSLDAYYYMVKQGVVIIRSYGISFLVTILGTVLSVLVTTTLAYPMSRKAFKYRNILSFFVFFTMLFNGGIVPSYIMWSRFFHIKNTIWALIIPNYLVEAGLTVEQEGQGGYVKIQTKQGQELGIKTVDRIGPTGYTYQLLMYPERVQRMITSYFVGPRTNTAE